jgi:hypothetical protein
VKHPRPTAKLLPIALLVAGFLVAPLSAQSAFSRGEKPFTTISRMFLGDQGRDSLVTLARSQVGTRYRWGASAPGKAFDCSGLVQWLMANFDVTLPRTSREQAHTGLEIPKDPEQLLPGDLLFFGRGKTVNHVGVYIGNGKFVHAANRRLGVIVSSVPTGSKARTWWKGVRRLFASEQELTELPTPVLSPVFRSFGS